DAEGLEAEGVENLKELQQPAILHVVIDNRLQHYFVYYGFDKLGQVIIGDPAKGIISYKANELDALWQSKALLKVSPNSNFVKAETQNNQRKQWSIDLAKEDIVVLIAALFLGLISSALGLTTASCSQRRIDSILASGDTKKLMLSLVLVGIR